MRTKRLPTFIALVCCLLLLAPAAGSAQGASKPPVTVSGTVRGEDSTPLSGVSVMVRGTRTGAVTDATGRFSLRVAADGVLTFTQLGMKTIETPVLGRTTLNVTMSLDAYDLDQIVAIGYGTARRADIAGSVGTVSADAFDQQAIVDVNQALSGQIAGVNVMNTSGTPGGGLDIQIRGISTISSSATPLYVIDGVPIQTDINADSNPLSFINPGDIESMDILKDASASAIYGSRASNGVVLITTKSGKTGDAKVTLDVKVGMQQLFNKVDVLTGREYAEMSIEARNNSLVDNGKPVSTPDADRGDNLRIGRYQDFLASGAQGTDWQDAIFHNALIQEYQLTVSGGTDKVKYMVSANYTDQEGILRNTGFQRYSFRANLDIQANKRLKVGAKIAPAFTDQDFLPATGRYHDAFAGIVQASICMNPMLGIYDPTTLSGFTSGINQGGGIQNCENPFAKTELLRDWRRNFVLVGSAYADYLLASGLTARVSGSTSMRFNRLDRVIPSTLGAYSAVPPRDNAVTSDAVNILNWQAAAQLTWDKIFCRQHKINATAVYEMQMQQENSIWTQANGTWTDEFIVVDSNLSSFIRTGQSNISEWALMSWIGRVSYDFAGRYQVTGSVRADGTSKFANRWGVFPSAAVAWRVTNEPFMKKVRWLHDLKLRASYGLTGNNSIGYYEYMSLMGGASYVLGKGGETIVSGIRQNSYGNPNLTWEKTRQMDAGIDLSVLRGRISLTADIYDKQTQDLLLRLQTPGAMGHTSVLTNIGKVRNRGLELTLDTRNLVRKFKWSTNINVSFNRQKVLALGPEGDPLYGNSVYMENTHITRVGHPMGEFYGLKVIGIYNTQEQVDQLPGIKGSVARSRPGEFIFKDVFQDYKIDTDDRTVVGNPHPDFTFGMTNTFAWKNLNLRVFVRGSYGAELLNFNYGTSRFMSNVNMPASVLRNRWKSAEEPGDGKTPRLALLNRGTLGTETLNSSYVQDASFLNIQNVTLTYNVPQKISKKIYLSNLRIYGSVQNLYMFTSYECYNPEGGMNTGATLAPGVDWGRYPLARTFTFGANITF